MEPILILIVMFGALIITIGYLGQGLVRRLRERSRSSSVAQGKADTSNIRGTETSPEHSAGDGIQSLSDSPMNRKPTTVSSERPPTLGSVTTAASDDGTVNARASAIPGIPLDQVPGRTSQQTMDDRLAIATGEVALVDKQLAQTTLFFRVSNRGGSMCSDRSFYIEIQYCYGDSYVDERMQEADAASLLGKYIRATGRVVHDSQESRMVFRFPDDRDSIELVD